MDTPFTHTVSPSAVDYSGGPLSVEKVRDQRERSLYDHESEQIDKALAILSNTITQLIDRLHVILDPEPPGALATEDRPARVISAPLINHLNNHTERITEDTDRLMDALRRLVI